MHENRDREGCFESRSLEALGFIEIELSRELEQARGLSKEALSVEPEAKEPSLERGAAEVVIGKASRLAQRDRAHQSRDRLGGALGFVEAELHREAANRERAQAGEIEAAVAAKAFRISARSIGAGALAKARRRRAVKRAVGIRAGRRTGVFEVVHAHKGMEKSKWVALRGRRDGGVALESERRVEIAFPDQFQSSTLVIDVSPRQNR